MPFVYMLHCAGGSIYTGSAQDIGRRLWAHYYQTSACAKYTRSHPVLALAALWETETFSAATKLEYRIKQLSAFSKRELIAQPETLMLRFPELGAYTYTYQPGAKLEALVGTQERRTTKKSSKP